MLVVDLSIPNAGHICKVGILRVFPHTKLVAADQVCHYDYGFLDNKGKIIKEGRLKHLWSDGPISLSGKVMSAMSGKVPSIPGDLPINKGASPEKQLKSLFS